MWDEENGRVKNYIMDRGFYKCQYQGDLRVNNYLSYENIIECGQVIMFNVGIDDILR